MSFIGDPTKIIQNKYGSSIVTGVSESSGVLLVELDTNGIIIQKRSVNFSLSSNQITNLDILETNNGYAFIGCLTQYKCLFLPQILILMLLPLKYY